MEVGPWRDRRGAVHGGALRWRRHREVHALVNRRSVLSRSYRLHLCRLPLREARPSLGLVV